MINGKGPNQAKTREQYLKIFVNDKVIGLRRGKCEFLIFKQCGVHALSG